VNVQLSLFGAFREFERSGLIELEVPQDARVAELREALSGYAQRHWPGFQPGLLACSAFASDTDVLRDADRLPPGRPMAVLPPVSGG
jgi:molybdopterin synthase sulfur carrier subunit